MIRIAMHLMVGILLSGCTFNNFHSNDYNSIESHGSNDFVSTKGEDVEVVEKSSKSKPVRIPKQHVRTECEVYVPLPVPKPTQVDFAELAAAKTGKEINAITLRNVKSLHSQLNNHAVNQKKHYADYLKRCVVKDR